MDENNNLEPQSLGNIQNNVGPIEGNGLNNNIEENKDLNNLNNEEVIETLDDSSLHTGNNVFINDENINMSENTNFNNTNNTGEAINTGIPEKNINLNVYNPNYQRENPVIEPTKKKKSKAFLLILLVVLLVAIGGGAFYYYQKYMGQDEAITPIQVYKNAVNELYNNIDSMVGNKSFSLDILNESFYLEGRMTLNTDLEEAKILNGIKLDLMGGLNYKNKEASLRLGLSKNTNYLKALISIINSKGYLECKDIFDKTIDIGAQDIFTELEDTLGEVNLSEINEIMKIEELQKLKEIIINSLDEKKFTTLKETVNLEGKDYQVTTIKYLMDQENKQKLIDAIKSDEKLNDLFGLEEETDDLGEDFEIVTYVVNNKIIGGNIHLLEEEPILNFTNIDDLLKIKGENEGYTLSLEETQDNYLFTLKDEEATFTVSITKAGSGSLSFKSAEGELEFNYKNITNNQDELGIDFDLKMEVKEDTSYTISINNAHLGIKKGTFEKASTNGAVAIDLLTEEELNKALENIRNIAIDFGIDIDSFLGSDSDYNYDYDYDDNYDMSF